MVQTERVITRGESAVLLVLNGIDDTQAVPVDYSPDVSRLQVGQTTRCGETQEG